ncbi:MAG: hypothetical protein ACJ798_04170 [Phenylobacterium sp.]
MIRMTIAAAALASLGLAGCSTWMGGESSKPTHSAALEQQNARDQNSNGSVQPGGAGPSPSGGNSNPGTSGTVSPRPHDQTANPH